MSQENLDCVRSSISDGMDLKTERTPVEHHQVVWVIVETVTRDLKDAVGES